MTWKKLFSLWYNVGMESGFYILVAFTLGFVLAQVAKLLTAFVRQKFKISFDEIKYWMMRSGGMPSGHSASFIAATTYVGLERGFGSLEFAIMTCMAMIILYDAINVRYAVGEQGKTMNKILAKAHKELGMVKIVEGHTVQEVIVGSILGILIGIITWAVAHGGWL